MNFCGYQKITYFKSAAKETKKKCFLSIISTGKSMKSLIRKGHEIDAKRNAQYTFSYHEQRREKFGTAI